MELGKLRSAVDNLLENLKATDPIVDKWRVKRDLIKRQALLGDSIELPADGSTLRDSYADVAYVVGKMGKGASSAHFDDLENPSKVIVRIYTPSR